MGKSNYSLRLMVTMVIGIAAILVTHYLVAQWLGRTITDGMLAREGQVKQEFLSSILAAEHGETQLFAEPRPSPALVSFAAHVTSLPGIMRANIYSPDGFIRQSTEANMIGLNFSGNDELKAAFDGKITSALEVIRASGKAEHLALTQLEGEKLIEAYIPVAAPDGKIVTVVEFYRKDTWIETLAWEIERGL
jgi:two-component system, NtrC family, sensor histidine kinase HydH